MGRLHKMAANGYDIPNWLAAEGMVFTASDADQNDVVTGQTSFANTTPTFLLDVPDGTIAIPLEVNMYLTGTVPGGEVTVIIEKDNADRYASGGTAEGIYNDFGKTALCALYSGATANAGFGSNLYHYELAADVGEAAEQTGFRDVLWVPARTLELIPGPGALAIYTHAATTGPSWAWHIKWAEIPEDWVS